MAVLTWRNVDDPNFRGAVEGYRAFSDLLGNATSGLSAGLQNFAEAPGRAQDLEMRRAAQMLTQQAGQQNLTQQQYQFGRTQNDDASLDAVRDVNSRIQLASARGDMGEAQRIAQENQPLLGQVNPSQLNTLLNNAAGQTSSNLNNRSASFTLGNQILNDTDSKAATSAMQQIQSEATSLPAARALLEARTDLSPGAKKMLTNQLSGMFGQIYGPLNAADAAGGGIAPNATISTVPSGNGIAGTQSGDPYDTGYKFAQTPFKATETPISGILDHQAGMIKSLGASPMGAFQINKATLEDFGPKVLGKDWRSQPFSAENQDKLGKAIFEDSKNGNLKARWDALPNATPGAYKDKSWDEMKGIIAQAEIGNNLKSQVKASRVGSAEAQGQVAIRSGQNITADAAERLFAAANDTRTVAAVTDDLIKTDMPGSDRSAVMDRIRTIQTESGGTISPAQAAEIMRDSLESDRGFLNQARAKISKFTPFLDPNLGGGVRLNEDRLNENIKLMRSGKLNDTVVANRATADIGATVAAAQTEYANAAAEVSAIQERAKTQPGAASQLPAARQKLAMAKAAREAALKAQREDPNANAKVARK